MGSEKQEKERREKAKPATERIGKVSREEHERQRAVTKEIERARRKALEKEEREKLEREKREAEAAKETNPKKEVLRSAPARNLPNPPEDVPHWINASDGSLKSFREVHRLSQWQQDGAWDVNEQSEGWNPTAYGLTSSRRVVTLIASYVDGGSKGRSLRKRLNKRRLIRPHRPKLFERPRKAGKFHHLLCHHLLWDHQSHFQWETLRSWSQGKVKLWKQSKHSKWEMCPRWKLILFGWSLGREHHLEEWIELWGEQLMKHSRTWVSGSRTAIKDQVLRKIHQALNLWAWFLERIVKGEKSVTERDHHLLKKELVKSEWPRIEIEVKMAVKKEEMMTVESDSGIRTPVLTQNWISWAKEETPKQLWCCVGNSGQWSCHVMLARGVVPRERIGKHLGLAVY